jgi:hypothetical protein
MEELVEEVGLDRPVIDFSPGYWGSMSVTGNRRAGGRRCKVA